MYLREAEHGNVVLRLAVSTPADDILDAINAPDLDLAIDAAEDAAKDGVVASEQHRPTHSPDAGR